MKNKIHIDKRGKNELTLAEEQKRCAGDSSGVLASGTKPSDALQRHIQLSIPIYFKIFVFTNH